MVRAVDTGQAALEMIVTDISIPDDGLWLTREVMEAAGAMGIRIPIIAVTAFIRKPLDPLALCTTIREHVAPA